MTQELLANEPNAISRNQIRQQLWVNVCSARCADSCAGIVAGINEADCAIREFDKRFPDQHEKAVPQ